MDGPQFDRLTRALRPNTSRRHALHSLVSLGTAAGFAAGGYDVAAKRRRKKKKKQGNPCEGQPDDAPCNGSGRCFRGGCVPRPVCGDIQADCTDGSTCCSTNCHPGYFHCVESLLGFPCYEDYECIFGAQCLAYRCVEERE
jgi:hypothetical protein